MHVGLRVCLHADTGGPSGNPLSKQSVRPEPIDQCDDWLADAAVLNRPNPMAAALATATSQGQPSVRMVLLKEHTADGVIFYTNSESRKGIELKENPHAALLLWWDELARQIRIEGPVSQLSEAMTQRYFDTRPLGSQISAWSSAQSEIVVDRATLELQHQQMAEKLSQQDRIPKPPFWNGYRLVPSSYEFWQGRDDRLHDRIRYRRDGGHWIVERLCP